MPRYKKQVSLKTSKLSEKAQRRIYTDITETIMRQLRCSMVPLRNIIEILVRELAALPLPHITATRQRTLTTRITITTTPRAAKLRAQNIRKSWITDRKSRTIVPMHKNNVLWAAVLTAAFIFGPLRGAKAENRATVREHMLENKIKDLEGRISRLEKILNAQTQEEGQLSRDRNAFHSPIDSIASDKSIVSNKTQPEKPTANTDVDADTTTKSGVQKSAPPGADDSPQELYVMRENAVTLKPNRLEVSSEIAYSSRRTSLQTDNGFLSNTSLRYGFLDWLELSVTIPYGFTSRTTNIGPSQEVQYDARGVGDILAQFNAKVIEQSRNWPGVVVSLGGIFPTGHKPYDFNNYALDAPNFVATPNPVNPLLYYYSQGAWGVRTNVQLYKTVDPIIIFAGVGLTYLLPQTVGNYQVKMGLGYTYNMGISFAASERTTLGFSFNGGYTSVMKVNGRKVFSSSVYPAVSRLTIIQRVSQRVYLEPSLTFGLNQDVPNFTVAMGVRVRF